VGVGDALIILSFNELWDFLEVLISPDLYHSCRMITEMNYSVRLEPALSFWDFFSGRRYLFCAPKSLFLLCHYVRTEKARQIRPQVWKGSGPLQGLVGVTDAYN